MTMKKFLTTLLAATFALALACGKGKEVTKAEDEGEDDQQAQTTTTAAEGAAATAPAATAAAAPAVADAATLTGTIKFAGAAPTMPTIQMNADPYCQSQHSAAPAKDEEVVVGAGGELANVLVYIKNAPPGAPTTSTPAVIDQHGCQYHPHVQAVEVNQPIQIKNSDATLHNIHAQPKTNREFNFGMPDKSDPHDAEFKKPEEAIHIKCDVHPWMGAFCFVMEHPYFAVSAADGSFTIDTTGLPDGDYNVKVWQEVLGSAEGKVTVKDGNGTFAHTFKK